MKNLGRGGKGFKKSKKTPLEFKRELALKTNGLDYGRVIQLLGGGQISVKCLSDDVTRIGIIRGSMYKREWVVKDDFVLVSLREFENTKCDVILKYTNDEVKQLIEKNEIQSISKQSDDDNHIIFSDNESGSDHENANEKNKNSDYLSDFDIDDI
jgi:translation initiation factor 1A